MPRTSIGSLIKPVTNAVKEAAKDVQALVKTARCDIKRRNFDRRVSLTSVKAIKPAIAEPPRQDMDDAEIALMNEVRGYLNGLTTRRSPDTDPEALATMRAACAEGSTI